MMACANENLPPKVFREVAKELKSLTETPPEGIRIIVSDDNIASIQAEIDGPTGTPYEGGVFRMKLVLGAEFPQVPPKGFFVTKIFHPNIAKNGEICVNTLKKDWKPSLGVRHVLVVVRCLLIEPFPESALNEDAGKLLMEDYAAYSRHAKLMTGIHAVKKSTTLLTTNGREDNNGATVASTTIEAPESTAKVQGGEGGGTAALIPSAKKVKGDTVMPASAGRQKVVEKHKRSLKRL